MITMILFIINIVVATIYYITDDLLRAIWFLLIAIIMLICDLGGGRE